MSKAKVHFGTCGWTDESIRTCGRFYPPWVKTSEDRLAVYSTRFPCVEVDSSTYAIPRPGNTRKWAAQTPAGFVFHFKAFGLFTHQSAALNTLPAEVRQLLPGHLQQQQPPPVISLQQLGEAGEKLAWQVFHAALEPVIKAGRMGCVMFQFQLSFMPTQQNREYVEHCRRMLREDVRMAVEFRNRSWFTAPDSAAHMRTWLSSLGVCLVSADELKHETAQKDREQRGLPPGQRKEILPISLIVTRPDMHYVRLHRRHGTTDRILPQEEIQAWAARLQQHIAPHVQGPIYYLWGTDWEDAPVINIRALHTALHPDLRYDWAAEVQRAVRSRPGSIAALLARQPAAAGASTGSKEQGASKAEAASDDGRGTSPCLPVAVDDGRGTTPCLPVAVDGATAIEQMQQTVRLETASGSAAAGAEAEAEADIEAALAACQRCAESCDGRTVGGMEACSSTPLAQLGPATHPSRAGRASEPPELPGSCLPAAKRMRPSSEGLTSPASAPLTRGHTGSSGAVQPGGKGVQGQAQRQAGAVGSKQTGPKQQLLTAFFK